MPLDLTSLFKPEKSFTVAIEDIATFTPYQQGQYKKEEPVKHLSKADDPATSLKVDLITDKLIMDSKLKPVSDPIPFASGNIPTPNGLFSKEIFGTTVDERKKQYGYIELNGKFFHPYVYEILRYLMPKKFEKCASGIGSWEIDSEGQLVPIKDPDPNEPEVNGIQWLMDNYHNLVLKKSKSTTRADRIKFLQSLKDDEIFITKWIVIPVFYRDVDFKSKIQKMPVIDTMYANVIRFANSLNDSPFAMFDNQVRYNIMQELVKIRKFGQSLIEGKGGFFHKSILGKSIDRGSRDVISVPTMTHMERPKDNPIDITHVGIPLDKCLIIGYDYIMRYCNQFFEAAFKNVKEYPVYKLVNGERVLDKAYKIKDQMQIFTPKYIEKRINRFKNSPESRFDPILITPEDDQNIQPFPMHMSGQFESTKKNDPNTSTIFNRVFTWTDLFYQAAVESLSDKWVYVTRYPIESHSSIFPVQCTPLSTIKTMEVRIGSRVFPNYPVIDLKLPGAQVAKLFNGTVAMSNLFLAAIGGDYDGDQTSQRLMFTLEANLEAEAIAYSVKNFVSPSGSMLRTLGNEAYLTFYNMTRMDKNAIYLKDEEKAALLKLSADTITVTEIAKYFGKTLDKSEPGKVNIRMPVFNVRSKFTLEAGELGNTEAVETTVGIYLFNLLMVNGMVNNILENGYFNKIVTKSSFSKISDAVAKGIMDKTVSINPTTLDWLRAYEFWGLKLVTIFASSYSMETIMPNPKVQKRKEELLAAAKDNDIDTLVGIEEELIALAGEELEGSDGKNLFNSGARGSFENDYKNMSISIGPVKNPVTGDYDFMSSSYMGGISKKDLVAAGNIIVNAEYPKAIGTAQGGYMTKQFYSVFQSMKVGEPGSDCGVNIGLELVLTKKDIPDYTDQYIIDGDKLVLIDANLPDKYLNKKIMIRSPMYCLAEDRCSKCCGERFYKTDIANMGLTVPALSGRIQSASLKLRHNMKISLDKIDETKILI